MNILQKIMILLGVFVLVMFGQSASVSAQLTLDSISFDPAIVAAGDEVDIVIQYHDDYTPSDYAEANKDEYEFKVTLESDDDLTKNYVTIQDAVGDDLIGSVYSGKKYNKVFRVKVAQNAPAGNYEFKLTGRWYYQGEPLDSHQYVRFYMPVKKEGIILDVATISTQPAEVRTGDDYVRVSSFIENAGEKDAKSVLVKLQLPDGFESSYADNNRVWVGVVGASESKEVDMFIDIDEDVEPGVYDLLYSLTYMDSDDNSYQTTKTIPFRVKGKPRIEITDVQSDGVAGSQMMLKLTVTNEGDEAAESVDVRLIKQSAQPFNFDVRSDYVGELLPGESGTALFTFDVDRTAPLKEHDMKVLIRAKGDSDEGDENIYLFNRRAQFTLSEVAPNKLKIIGFIAIAVIVSIGLIKTLTKKRSSKKVRK